MQTFLPPRVPLARFLLPSVLAFVALGGATSARPTSASELDPARPDVVLILLDDLDWTDVSSFRARLPGTFGLQNVATPHLDALAADAVSFTQFRTMGAVCSPTRASILYGAYPARFGIRRIVPEPSVRGIPYDHASLASVLGDAGYHTVHVGKWHLGEQKPGFLPLARGFDHSVTRLSGKYTGYEIAIDDEPRVPPLRPDQFLTEYMTDRAIEHIEDAPCEQPLFLNLWYLAPHRPLHDVHLVSDCPDTGPNPTPEEEVELYGCMVEHVDAQIDRVLQAIANGPRNRERDTIVIVASDNGGIPEFRRGFEMRWFNGYKGQVLEGGTRTPLIVRWPRAQESLPGVGGTNETLVTSFDLYPTLAELVGIDVPEDLPGESMLDVLTTGVERPRGDEARWLFWENKESNRHPESTVPGSEPLEPYDFPTTFATRNHRYKYVFVDGVERFYDLVGGPVPGTTIVREPDPRELVDLAPELPDTVAAFRRRYFKWRSEQARFAYAPAVLSPTGAVDDTENRIYELDGGWVEIGHMPSTDGSPAFDPRIDVHDGDFSFLTRVDLHPDMVGSKGVVARKEGSWRLFVDEAGALRLIVQDAGTGSEPPRPPVLLTSGEVTLDETRSWHVGFTIDGYRQDEADVRLYVDGIEVDRVHDASGVWRVGFGEEPIRLGNNGGGTAPFRGRIAYPKLFCAGLYPCEVAADHACQDSRDVCVPSR